MDHRARPGGTARGVLQGPTVWVAIRVRLVKAGTTDPTEATAWWVALGLLANLAARVAPALLGMTVWALPQLFP